MVQNTVMDYPDIVRFDEEENPTVFWFDCTSLCPQPEWYTPSVVLADAGDRWWWTSTVELPGNPNDALAGWMYFNLHNGRAPHRTYGEATQAWLVLSMSAEGRFSADFDATPLGNGCSPVTEFTDERGDLPAIGPAPNINPGAVPNP